MSQTNKVIVVNFSGCASIAPENVKFEYVGLENKPVLISGTQYTRIYKYENL